MNASNLEVLSSEEYSGARREFNDEDWKGATNIVSRYYNLVLADCGAGLFQPAARGVLSTVSGSGDRRERVDRRRPSGRGDDGLVAAERISGSAGPVVRGDQPRRARQAEHRRRAIWCSSSSAMSRRAASSCCRRTSTSRPAPRSSSTCSARTSSGGSSSWPPRCPTTSTGSNGVDLHRRRSTTRRASRPAGRRPRE